MTLPVTIGGRQSSRMDSDVWLTPPHILAALGEFDLDPCACPPPRPWATAQRMIARPDDGLAAHWTGRVWLNPPYSRIAPRWIKRLAEHGRGTAMLFARTETSWFVDHVWRRATAILFLANRVNFHHHDGSRAEWNGGAPSVLVAYGEDDADRLSACRLPGSFVREWRTM